MTAASVQTGQELHVDVAIVGGGIAGLWLLNRAANAGYSTLLIEKAALGAGQTLASQGMIHGGVKYMLGGITTGASETIAGMPARWQDWPSRPVACRSRFRRWRHRSGESPASRGV